MSRDWFAVYSATLHHPKYRRTSPSAKASLFHIWLLATNRTPEAYWPSRAALADELDLDGLDPATIDELVRLHWLDSEDDGGLAVHDWDLAQYGASKAIRDAWEAARMREWRRRVSKKRPTPEENKTGQDSTGQDSTGSADLSVRRSDAKHENVPRGEPTTRGQRVDNGAERKTDVPHWVDLEGNVHLGDHPRAQRT